MNDTLNTITGDLSRSVPNLIGAILILILGWLIAIVAAWIVKAVLSRTSLDNRLAKWITGRDDSSAVTNIEKWTATAVFWVIMIFVLVAFLQALQLTAVSEPLSDLLRQVFAYLPKIAGAAILLGVAWLIATLARMLLARGLKAFSLDEKLNQAGDSSSQEGPATRTETTGTSSTQTFPQRDDLSSGTTPTTQAFPERETDLRSGTTSSAQTPTSTSSRDRDTRSGGNQFLLSETLGNALYWFIFLLFLPAILGALELDGLLEPVRGLLDKILAILPNILAALIIGLVGWFIARVVRLIVTNLLKATGADSLGERFGLGRATGGKGLSWLAGYIVYVLILIPAAIAALNTLQLDAISDPATNMLQQILNSLPLIFTAALILAVAYVIGKFVGDLVTNILTSVGFNNVFSWLGIQDRPQTPSNISAPAPGSSPGAIGTPSTTAGGVPQQTPSELAGIVVLVGIMLFAAVTATNVLGFEALTAIVTGLIVILGRILAGLVIFAVGLYLANLAFRLIVSSGGGQARILAQTARVAIIALVAAMALQQMGIASSIVNLAFGLLLGAIAVAIALAFGLGSMDIAAGEVRGWLDSFKNKDQLPPRY